MKQKLSILSPLIVVAGLVFACAPIAGAHKYHTSFAAADYNSDEQSLQVSLRTFQDDLTEVLSRRAGRKISLDRRREAEPLALAYLQDVFQIKRADGELLKLSWVGMEVNVDSVWLYFEVKVPGGIKGLYLRNLFMHDLFDDQTNLINVKEGGRKNALTFSRNDGFKAIEAVR
jgi:hypothetical protein